MNSPVAEPSLWPWVAILAVAVLVALAACRRRRVDATGTIDWWDRPYDGCGPLGD